MYHKCTKPFHNNYTVMLWNTKAYYPDTIPLALIWKETKASLIKVKLQNIIV